MYGATMPECSEPPKPEMPAAALGQDQHGLVAEVAACATVFLGHGSTQEAIGPGLFPGTAVHHAGLAPGFILGSPLLLEKTAGRVEQHLVLVGHPGGGEVVNGHRKAPCK
jgi:hypothetical protein